jgi:p24 family protein alpha
LVWHTSSVLWLILIKTGTYKAEAFNSNTNAFGVTSELSIQVTVDETFDNDHRVVTQTSQSADKPSKFTFSAADSGLHRLCFTPSGPAAVSVGGWFANAGVNSGGVKLNVDLAIGETSKIESEDKGKIDSIVGKVKELNGRLADIRREQVFQRVSSFVLWWMGTDDDRNEKRSLEIRARRRTRKS